MGVRCGFLTVFVAASTGLASTEWPDLSVPPAAEGGGESDAALIIGIENYGSVAPVPGAVQNAQDWYRYLTRTRKVPVSAITLLRDNEGTLERMRQFASKSAQTVKAGGTLWFIFIGHGAPAETVGMASWSASTRNRTFIRSSREVCAGGTSST